MSIVRTRSVRSEFDNPLPRKFPKDFATYVYYDTVSKTEISIEHEKRGKPTWKFICHKVDEAAFQRYQAEFELSQQRQADRTMTSLLITAGIPERYHTEIAKEFVRVAWRVSKTGRYEDALSTFKGMLPLLKKCDKNVK